jgi:glycosyltransferase involved in cell wall biosynthesis
VAGTVTLHRAIGTWRRKVSRYIALNRFCRDKFVQGGLPAERMRIKPNFVDVPAPPSGARAGGLFVGRLSAEKGVSVLARALSLQPGVVLSVVGAGDLDATLRAVVGDRMLGFLQLPEILALMQRSSWLVVPSIWYENFPRTIVEAYACGLPVIASRVGALPELVEDGQTGLLFDAGSPEDLASKLAWAQRHPDEMARMGECARSRYEALYTPARNHDALNQIYAEAIDAERRTA